ncbi:SoxR reducing system RseC family protein [Vibrio sp.]|nr:SoxR reducing system RseC family protein [Vibrio sp.]
MMTALATVADIQLLAPEENHQSSEQQPCFQVTLTCEQKTSCGSCASKKQCGTGIVSSAVGSKSLRWTLLTQEPLSVGDVVEIGLPEQTLLRSASVVYLIPLLALIVGAFIGHLWLAPLFSAGEGAVILISAIFTGGGIYLAKYVSRQIEPQADSNIKILRSFGQTFHTA